MVQYLSLALGFANILVSIFVYRKMCLPGETRKEQPIQKYDDTNIQNILNNRLLEIQNRRYSVRTNLER